MIVNEGGKKLPKLTTPGTSADLLTGKELIDQYGRKIEGSMPIAEMKAPRIVNTDLKTTGTIHAVAEYDKAYYAVNGTYSAHYKLSSNDDPNFIPENIVSGKRIFGVTGTADFSEYYQNAVNGDIRIFASNAQDGSGNTDHTIDIRIPSDIDPIAGHFVLKGDPTGNSAITVFSFVRTNSGGEYIVPYSGLFISGEYYYYSYKVLRVWSSGDPDGYSRLSFYFRNMTRWDLEEFTIEDSESYYIYCMKE